MGDKKYEWDLSYLMTEDKEVKQVSIKTIICIGILSICLLYIFTR